MVNGHIRNKFIIRDNSNQVNENFYLTIKESSWAAARIYGENNHWQSIREYFFAHTNPVFFTVNEEPVTRNCDIHIIIHWIENLIRLSLTEGNWSNPSYSTRTMNELWAAWKYYGNRIHHITGTIGQQNHIPPPLFLKQNTPNPFSDHTTIECGYHYVTSHGNNIMKANTGKPLFADCAIYDVRGRIVRRLLNGYTDAGIKKIVWNGKNDSGEDVSSGVYFCKFSIGYKSIKKKIILIR